MNDREKFKRPPQEACDYLLSEWGIRRSPLTLAKIRCVSSEGPTFVKAGRDVLYSFESLDVYARKLISAPRSSTSDTESRAA
jgi:hypothetical protein